MHRGARVPFGDLRPEHLVWRRALLPAPLRRHPSLRTQLTGFFGNEERQAEEFRRRLWELISAPDRVRTGDGLTPVQRWIIAASAHAAVDGFLL